MTQGVSLTCNRRCHGQVTQTPVPIGVSCVIEREKGRIRSLPGALAGVRWQPATHPARTLIVTCIVCRASIVNESNRMHRAGWQETVNTPRRYRCPECADR